MCNIQCRQMSSQPLAHQIVLLQDIKLFPHIHSLKDQHSTSVWALNWSCFLWMSYLLLIKLFLQWSILNVSLSPVYFFVFFSFFLWHVCFKFWWAGSFFPHRRYTVLFQPAHPNHCSHSYFIIIQLNTVNFAQIQLNTHQVLLLI